MIAERQAALEKIGFEWGLGNNSFWQTVYEELLAFKQHRFLCTVTYEYENNKSLAKQISNQRHQCGLSCKMSSS